MAGQVHYEARGNCAILTIDHAPVNAIGADVRIGLAEGVARASADDAIRGIVIAGARGSFSAGADINEFGRPAVGPVPDHLEIVENSVKPVVAALEGIAFGGGLELALACHHRVASPATKLGLPEVKIGLVPGGGGTQRLPRLVGLERALDMICTGEPVSASHAREQGLLDEVADGDIVEAAIAFLCVRIAEGKHLVRDRDGLVEEAKANRHLVDKARAAFALSRRGVEAPQRCIDAVALCLDLPFDAALERERAIFLDCVASAQSKALRHIFFAEREARKIPDVPADTPTRPIDSAAVIGAGTMGGGIAMNFANAGIPVLLVEQSREALDRGLAVVRRNYENSARRGRISEADVEARMALIRPTLSLDDVAGSDIVIEAVFENMDIKKEIFGKLDRIAKRSAILATNTSTLDVDEIAAATGRPQDVIGLHFFSPANVMPLLEEVRGRHTAHDVIATSLALARRIAKVPVLVGVCDGFVGNRMVAAYGGQARQLILEGALPEEVDKTIYDFGFAMGPFAMSDLAGLDVGWRIRQGKGMKEPIADRLCEMGRFGQKTGAGFYRYEKGDRTPHPDPLVKQIIEDVARESGIGRRPVGEEEILHRCVLALVNEGAKILEEGIALRASDIDVVYVHGYGFPRQRGGPMHWADSLGLPAVLAKIREYWRRFPDDPVWEPAPLIERLAAGGSSFAAYDSLSSKAAA